MVPKGRVESGVAPGETKIPISRGRRMSWAECLKRTFQIDLTRCPDCAGEVRFIAAVLKRDAIRAILRHLKLDEFVADEDVQLPVPGLNPLVRGPPTWDEHCQIPQYNTDF